MTRPITVLAVLAAASAASGCAGFAGGRGAPDEFRVVTQAPLSLPPDYNLRPPRPGEPRPQEQEAGAEAQSVLFGQDVGATASAGERRLIADAGAEAADADIRDTIDFEAQGVVRRNRSFVDRLLVFRGSAAPPSAPLNAEEEARRIEEQEAIRRATGGGQVVIERDRGGFKLPGT